MSEKHEWTLDEARALFPVGRRILFPDPTAPYEHLEIAAEVIGEPYPATDGYENNRWPCIKVPTRHFGGIVVDHIRFDPLDFLAAARGERSLP